MNRCPLEGKGRTGGPAEAASQENYENCGKNESKYIHLELSLNDLRWMGTFLSQIRFLASKKYGARRLGAAFYEFNSTKRRQGAALHIPEFIPG
jgi:hypothetical protein